MKRAKNNKSAKSERLTITLAGGQRSKLKMIADRRHVSEATVIRWALDEYVSGSEEAESRKKRAKSR